MSYYDDEREVENDYCSPGRAPLDRSRRQRPVRFDDYDSYKSPPERRHTYTRPSIPYRHAPILFSRAADEGHYNVSSRRQRSPSPDIARARRELERRRDRAPTYQIDKPIPDREVEYIGRERIIYDEDEDAGPEYTYSFKLSRHTRDPSRDSSVGSLSDTSEPLLDTITQPHTKVPAAGKTLKVLQSRYAGDGMIEGLQAVQMVVTEEVGQTSKSSTESLFRWM